MPKVFISYRQESESHRGRVRALAERLRTRLAPQGIEIVLDQFLLEQKPGGPKEGWPKWSAAQVQEAQRVVMIASPGWVDCFMGRTAPGVGDGAACEAHVIYQELYDVHWKSDKFRVCLLDPSHAGCLPIELKGFHRFACPADDEGLCAWLMELVASATGSIPAAPRTSAWPVVRPDFRHGLADREKVFAFFREMLAGQSAGKRILFIRADTNHGKSALVEKFTEYAEGLLPWALVDLKGTPAPPDVLAELNRELNKRLPGWRAANTLGEAITRLEESAQTRPLLILFDTYEQGAEELRKTLEREWLGAVRRTETLCFIVSGQKVPSDWGKAHWAKWVHAAELDTLDKADDWERWARDRHPALTRQHIEALAVGLKGVPGNVAAALDTIGASLGQRPAA